MIERLEQLAFAVGAVSSNDAKQVVDAVNDRVMTLLNAQVVKLYWREEVQEGFILDPMAYVNRHGTPIRCRSRSPIDRSECCPGHSTRGDRCGLKD
jgi:hypothetical protein